MKFVLPTLKIILFLTSCGKEIKILTSCTWSLLHCLLNLPTSLHFAANYTRNHKYFATTSSLLLLLLLLTTSEKRACRSSWSLNFLLLPLFAFNRFSVNFLLLFVLLICFSPIVLCDFFPQLYFLFHFISLLVSHRCFNYDFLWSMLFHVDSSLAFYFASQIGANNLMQSSA